MGQTRKSRERGVCYEALLTNVWRYLIFKGHRVMTRNLDGAGSIVHLTFVLTQLLYSRHVLCPIVFYVCYCGYNWAPVYANQKCF